MLVTACMAHGFGGCMPGGVHERTTIMFGSFLHQASCKRTAASPSQLWKCSSELKGRKAGVCTSEP